MGQALLPALVHGFPWPWQTFVTQNVTFLFRNFDPIWDKMKCLHCSFFFFWKKIHSTNIYWESTLYWEIGLNRKMGKIHSALYRVNYRWLFYLQREGPLGGKTTCLGPCPPALDTSCVFSHSVVSSCLPPHGGRLLRPWDSLCENTAVGCHFLLQGIFLTQGSNPHLLHCRWIAYCWATGETL